MGLPRFTRPKCQNSTEETPNLFVANCGPAVGVTYEAIAAVFGSYGEVRGVYPADESGARVIVAYSSVGPARAAIAALHGRPCPVLAGRSLHIRPSVLQLPSQVSANDSVPVAMGAEELNIPGLKLVHEFVSSREEQELLVAVDERPWKNLSKRRVQHYGYEFCYDIRNVDTKCFLGGFPSFVSSVIERITSSANLVSECSSLDQLTVNEYPPGVGLSPHIDTHSAFEGSIFSLSLAGPCIMEFRRYSDGSCMPKASSNTNEDESCDGSRVVRKALFLPPRSILLLSGEARYAWHHYIPHHKIDKVKDSEIRRASRRVSFTFRKNYKLFMHDKRRLFEEAFELICPVCFRCEEVLADVNILSIVIPKDNMIRFCSLAFANYRPLAMTTK